ncbi:phosphoribosylglycinamide formyltransferase [bacterium]|nr:phosphoribosylglycinamide formyltransferase [bacterium]
MQSASNTPAAEAFPIAVLISGSGSTLKNILALIAAGRLPVRVAGVIASRPCSGLDYAAEYGVPGAIVQRGKPFDAADFSRRITAQLDEWRPRLVVFGGFLSLYLAPPRYPAINIHPALLPGFGGQGMYGDRVHEAVLASGTRVTGCTVHLVDNAYDTGPIIAQRTVPVLDGDTVETLGARVRETERELYPEVIRWFAEDRVVIADGQVTVLGRQLRG